MIEECITKIARRMIKQEIIPLEHESIIRYGLQVMIESILVLFTSLVVSVSIGMTLEGLAVLGTVIVIRSFGGGGHASKFNQCYIISSAVFIIILWLERITVSYQYTISVISLMISVVLTAYIALFKERPRHNNNVDIRPVMTKINYTLQIVYTLLMITLLLQRETNSLMAASLWAYLCVIISKIINIRKEKLNGDF